MTGPLLDLIETLGEPGQPERLFRAVEETTRTLVGHRLFTLLCVDGDEVARIHSSRPAEYPVSGRKRMGPTDWGDLVLKRREPFLGRDRAAIRWAFFDHALIESMGLGSAICVPAVYDERTVGTMNLLDAEHHYRLEHVDVVRRLTPALVPAFLDAQRRLAAPRP